MKTLIELIDDDMRMSTEESNDYYRTNWLQVHLARTFPTTDYWGYISFLYQLEGWTGEADKGGFVAIVCANILAIYWDYYPRYQDVDSFVRDLKRNLSTGNKKLPSLVNQAFLQGLLIKYGLPNDLVPQTDNPSASDFAQIEDFLKERYVVESETGSLEGTGAGSTTSTTEGKSWDRTRPINYQTQDDTTADSVQGSSGTGMDIQETRTSQNTTRERTLSERQNSIISLVKELGDALKPLIPALVDAVAPCFVQEFSV